MLSRVQRSRVLVLRVLVLEYPDLKGDGLSGTEEELKLNYPLL
jgi:hypothetical protein